MHFLTAGSGHRLALLLLAGLLTACGGGGEGGQTHFVTIGTGATTGVYYPTGGAIANLVNAGEQAHGIRASVESTGGSVFNVNAVLSGDLDFGIAQADRQYQAWNGLAEWSDRGPQKELRAVCTLHPEMVTLIAADDAGISSVADLRGKRVNIGNVGSGSRINAIDVFKAAGIDPEADIEAQGIKASEAGKLLQDNRIDASFMTVGHPAGLYMEASAGRRKIRFIPITGMDVLIAESPYYSVSKIPVKHYPGMLNDGPVETIGVKTTLVTSASVPDEVVYAVTKAIFENLEAIREKHEALSDLTAEEMVTGSIAPVHAGAQRYFEEAGLL
jgi:hypothetical protein